jgi:hypothetical protein
MELGRRLFFLGWFGSSLGWSRLLALLQLLLLLGVFLRELLGLLLVLLLQLLLFRFIRGLLREALVILLLFGLQSLAFLNLLHLKPLLLLLVFLVLFSVASIWSGGTLGRG